VLGGSVAAGPGFGGLDERIDRLDTAVGEPGIEVTIQVLQLGHWGAALEGQDERVEHIVGLFAAGRKGRSG